jgi:hypothetical protein
VSQPCPLCGSRDTAPFDLAPARYFDCGECGLRFLDPLQRLSRDEESAYYATHRNDPADTAYRRFLSPLVDALVTRLTRHDQGLDYGCGPGSALAAMLVEQGFQVALYDPCFEPDTAVLQRRYAFVSCSEVAEHFHAPGEQFRALDGLLQPGGWLGVMTGILHQGIDFERWHYRRDPTHVCFYRPQTMQWIADALGWRLAHVDAKIALFQKP